MIGTTKTAPILSTFIRGLKTHPKGIELISIIEKILAEELNTVNPELIASFLELSNNNLTLLVDFWILRGMILEEEGKVIESFQTFLEVTQWQTDDVSIWLRIGEYFKNKNELIKASYFLSRAQEQFNLDLKIKNDINQMKECLENNLSINPGLNAINSASINKKSLDKNLMPVNDQKNMHTSSNVKNTWKKQ